MDQESPLLGAATNTQTAAMSATLAQALLKLAKERTRPKIRKGVTYGDITESAKNSRGESRIT